MTFPKRSLAKATTSCLKYSLSRNFSLDLSQMTISPILQGIFTVDFLNYLSSSLIYFSKLSEISLLDMTSSQIIVKIINYWKQSDQFENYKSAHMLNQFVIQWNAQQSIITQTPLNFIIPLLVKLFQPHYYRVIKYKRKKIPLMKGTSYDQDARFADKTKRMLEKSQWPDKYDIKIDLEKVDIDLIKSWIQKRVYRLLGEEDDIVSGTAISLLDNYIDNSQKPSAKKMHVDLSGFLKDKTLTFMSELWDLLDDAQKSPNGIPQSLIEQKRKLQEQQKKKLEQIRRKNDRYQHRKFDHVISRHVESKNRYQGKRQNQQQRKPHIKQEGTKQKKQKNHKDRSRSRDKHKKKHGKNDRDQKKEKRSKKEHHKRKHKRRSSSSSSSQSSKRRSNSESSSVQRVIPSDKNIRKQQLGLSQKKKPQNSVTIVKKEQKKRENRKRKQQSSQSESQDDSSQESSSVVSSSNEESQKSQSESQSI